MRAPHRLLSALAALGALAAQGALGGCSSDPTELPPPPLSITTFTLADAAPGVEYTARLVAAGGTAPYRWSVDAPPTWLTVGAASGDLGGKPLEAALPVELVVRVKDAAGNQAQRTLSLRVRGEPLTVESTTLPEGKELAAYSGALVARGGVPPRAWSVLEGALPRGVFLGATGAIAGQPDAAGTFAFTARVTDAEGAHQDVPVTLVVRPLVPMISADPLPLARFDEPYEHTLTARDVRPPVDWTVISGRLPRGLGLDINGLIAGRPSEDGLFPFVARVSGGGGAQRDEAMFELRVAAPLSFVTRTLPVAVIDRAYRGQIEARGGVPPLRYTLQGTLPAGLTFSSDGVLSGTTRAIGRYELTVRVEDAAASTPRTALYVLTVSDRYEYEWLGNADFPTTCTATAVAVRDVPIDIADSYAIASLSSVEVELDYRDAAAPGFPMQRLRLWLISPKGQTIVLCGDRFQSCPEPRPGVPLIWPPLPAQTPFTVVTDTNARGTWRLRVGVDAPTAGAGGACQQVGHVQRVRLVFADDRSSQPYGYVRGWFANNLIQLPWLRIRGANSLTESELSLTVERWSAGPNGIREAGEGDDVLAPDTVTWTIVTAPRGTTIAPDGHLVAGQVTGRGTARAEDGQGNITDVNFLVVPPDWNTQRMN